MKFEQTIKYWFPVILGMAFIYSMSTDALSSSSTLGIIEKIIYFFAPSILRNDIAVLNGVIRKLAHVIEYLVLGMLLFRAFRAGSYEQQWWRWAESALAVVILYALTDEFHQVYVPTRSASLVDVGLDTLGGILGQCAGVLYYYRQRQRVETSKF